MFRELIGTLTYLYSFAAKGRGILKDDEMRSIGATADTLADKAEPVLCVDKSTPIQRDDQTDLLEASMIRDHINEMITFQLQAEIV